MIILAYTLVRIFCELNIENNRIILNILSFPNTVFSMRIMKRKSDYFNVSSH